MEIVKYLTITLFYFLLWMLIAYWIHRIAHIPHKYNFLFKIHLAHHKYEYGKPSWPRWHEYFLWYGDLRSSLDVWITLTFPAMVITLIDPRHGIILLIINYIYEVFLGGDVLDHNPKIRGRITKIFAWGQFHLTHHRNVRKNYSFYITLWDHIFRTAIIKDKNKGRG
jgi:sterol desaturase/sphingolipid hydroxylase (fatty acid hydroxylase superfamily)